MSLHLFKNVWDWIDTAINQVSRIASVIGVIAVIMMMLVSITDIFLRYAFSQPILDSPDMVQYLMVVAGFTGLAWCAVKGGHVRVDLLVVHFSKKSQALFSALGYLLCLSVVPLVAWQGFEGTRYAIETHKGSTILEIPSYPFYLTLAIGMVLLGLVLVTLLVKSIAKAVKS
jgi:TRAP-type C4-dicarboxylate transport system permease small subunit